MLHRYFNNSSNARKFANEVIEKHGEVRVLPPVGDVIEVEWTPVEAHLRGGKPVRAAVRRVKHKVQRKLE
jgi:hypothetical protein